MTQKMSILHNIYFKYYGIKWWQENVKQNYFNLTAFGTMNNDCNWSKMTEKNFIFSFTLSRKFAFSPLDLFKKSFAIFRDENYLWKWLTHLDGQFCRFHPYKVLYWHSLRVSITQAKLSLYRKRIFRPVKQNSFQPTKRVRTS